jgi:hypothetical protein
MARPSRTPGAVHPEPFGVARMYERSAVRPQHVAQGRPTSAPSADPGPYGTRIGVERQP